MSTVGDESTATGGSTTAGDATSTSPETFTGEDKSNASCRAPDQSSVQNVCELSDQQVGECIMTNAAKIQQKIEDTAACWQNKSPKERLTAASACPKALFAELELQVMQAK